MSAALIAACALLLSADEASPVGGDYGQPRLLIAAPENPRFSHLAWPKVCQTNDGWLVVAFVAARAHTREGCPAVSVSRDGGKSFTRPHILREFDSTQDYAHCGNVALGTAEDGSVVLLAMAFTGDKRNTIFGWRSTDSGDTWQPVDTSSLADNKTGSVFGRIFPVPEKGLVALGHYRPPSEPSAGIWMSASQDHGRTWGAPRLVVPGRYYEPAAVFASNRIIEGRMLPWNIDGVYVWLGKQKPGLRTHPYEASDKQVTVIGVTKTHCIGVKPVTPVMRGRSRTPLYTTATGIDIVDAASNIKAVHGPYRIPTMLKRVDQLCRGLL